MNTLLMQVRYAVCLSAAALCVVLVLPGATGLGAETRPSRPDDVDWQHPVYITSFDSPAALDDWRLEGGRRMTVEEGNLVLESDRESVRSESKGNHLVCWLRREVPADFLLEFSVRPEDRRRGLNIVFFNARGRHGEEIFAPSLAPRDGTFAQYHSGDLDNYHISYWAGGRGTSNLRKNHGFHLVASGKDLVVDAPAKAWQTIRVYKREGFIRLTVDDVEALSFQDDGKAFGPIHMHSGWIGLRQMAHTQRCEYGHLGVYPLKAPSSVPASYLPAVRTFADNVLRHGRDVFGAKRTPLFADGLNVDTRAPVVWRMPEEQARTWNMPREAVISNLASQQNLFRVFVALTELTGDPTYKQAAVEATRYALDHLRHESGLPFWGGHAAWDLVTDQPIGEGRTEGVAGKHELKSNYPFYELLWEVDREATRTFVESFWNNHILRWDILDMNRHGKWHPVPAAPWDHTYVGGPVPFAGKGLTFFHTGSDMFYAAAVLSQLTGDARPLMWAKRMAQRYADARNPRTGLGADNYSTLDPDRMMRQFGAEFGDRFTEATVTSLYGNRYNRAAICRMKLFERLGADGEEFKRWAVEDLAAYAKHAYDPADNSFWPTLIDGTRLTPADRRRDGYVESRWLEKRPATAIHFWAYALAYRLTRDDLMWRMTRSIGRGIGLGDVGEREGRAPAVDSGTDHAEAETVFGLLELYQATRQPAYLALARRVGDNLITREFHKGFFVADKDHVFCKFDTVTPLALLHVEAAARGLTARIPVYESGRSFFHCPFEGLGRTYDNVAIYARLRQPGEATSPPQR